MAVAVAAGEGDARTTETASAVGVVGGIAPDVTSSALTPSPLPTFLPFFPFPFPFPFFPFFPFPCTTFSVVVASHNNNLLFLSSFSLLFPISSVIHRPDVPSATIVSDDRPPYAKSPITERESRVLGTSRVGGRGRRGGFAGVETAETTAETTAEEEDGDGDGGGSSSRLRSHIRRH